MPTARIDDGLTMYYEDHDFTDPWKRPEAVVIHHGLAGNSRLSYAWVPLLARHYRVIRPDARGCGRSTVPPPGYPWSLSGFARDLKGLLDHLGLEKVHLIGETLGGIIALQLAADNPERLRSVTVCSSPFRLAGVPWHNENEALVEREGTEAWVRKTMAPRLDPTGDPAHVEWMIRQLSSAPRHVILELMRDNDTQDRAAIFRRVRVPTQLIIGEKTAQREGFDPQAMRAMIPGSRLAIIPGAAGYVQHSDPDECVRIWREFVAGLG